jgi:ribosomal protein L7/L12
LKEAKDVVDLLKLQLKMFLKMRLVKNLEEAGAVVELK